MEGPPVKAAPEAIRIRPTLQSALFNTVLESARNRAPRLPELTPLQPTETWPGRLGLPSYPPPELAEIEPQRWLQDTSQPVEERRLLEAMERQQKFTIGGLEEVKRLSSPRHAGLESPGVGDRMGVGRGMERLEATCAGVDFNWEAASDGRGT